MLADDDQVLADRDRALPVLRRLLDNDSALELFRAAMPEAALMAVRCRYLRYKPGTSILAEFAATTTHGERRFHVTAYRQGVVDKLVKLTNRATAAPIIVAEQALAVWSFPLDGEIEALAAAVTATELGRLLARVAPHWWTGDTTELTPLRYKPQRRFVGRLDDNRGWPAVLRLYSPSEYRRARRAAKSALSTDDDVVPAVIGRSDRHAAILLEWVSGTALAEFVPADTRRGATADMTKAWRAAGEAVAKFHARGPMKLPPRHVTQEAADLRRCAADLAILCPELAREANDVVETCAAAFALEASAPTLIHGDLHLGQVVFDGSKARLIDIDAAAVGIAALDLGSLRVSLEASALADGDCDEETVNALWQEFMRGYGLRGLATEQRQVAAAAAAAWLRRTQDPFRHRQPQWRDGAAAAVRRASAALAKPKMRATAAERSAEMSAVPLLPPPSAIDSESAADAERALLEDRGLPLAAQALDPATATDLVGPLVRGHFGDAALQHVATRVLRHKPGRRCVVEYVFSVEHSGVIRSVLGKIHAKSRHRESFQRQQALTAAGFGAHARDRISVPAAVGCIDQLRMWLQERVPGVDAWTALSGVDVIDLGNRIVDAIFKLQTASLELSRTHTLDDEITLLANRLEQAAALRPDLRVRTERLLRQCSDRMARLSRLPLAPAHRDFYPDQVRVSADCLFVLDHDLLCLADPRLDVANFLGHLDELSIRLALGQAPSQPCENLGGILANARSLRKAILERFEQRAPNMRTDDVDFVGAVTLARHVFISTQIAARAHATEALLAACEEKLEPKFDD